MPEIQLKIRNLLAHKREQVQRLQAGLDPSLENFLWAPETLYLLSASSALTSPLGRPSPQDGHWQLQTVGSAPYQCQCHQLRNIRDENSLPRYLQSSLKEPQLTE